MSEQTIFKAGDFTSGKMGQIFKEAFMGLETTTINHKQFGDCYLIPKSEMKQAVNFMLGSFLNLTVDDSKVGPLEQMRDTPYSEFMLKMINTNDEGLQDESDYFSVLTRLIDCMYLYDKEWER